MSNEPTQSEKDLQDQLSKVVQPYYDIEIGKICTWLRKHVYEMHVTLDCKITFRDKKTNEIVRI